LRSQRTKNANTEEEVYFITLESTTPTPLISAIVTTQIEKEEEEGDYLGDIFQVAFQLFNK